MRLETTDELPTDELAPGQRLALLDASDVAKVLNCSARTVYRLADSGRIPPPVKLGALSRWPRRALEQWIAEGCPPCDKPRKRR